MFCFFFSILLLLFSHYDTFLFPAKSQSKKVVPVKSKNDLEYFLTIPERPVEYIDMVLKGMKAESNFKVNISDLL